MTASELRELAEKMHHFSFYQTKEEARSAMIGAAEVLELIAWAEDSEVHVERYGGMWFVYVLSNGVEYGNHSFIDTLRRAKGASNG